jgi:dolichyl-phosphate beta-glucosyltransferase
MKVSYDLTDTQCGLKIYKKAIAHKLYRNCSTKGFMFDIEVIYRAEKAGYTIREFPVSWMSDPDSRLLISNALFSMMSELWRIKRIL